MNSNIVHEIAVAISDLEEAISLARLAVNAEPIPRPNLLERLELYHSIVHKQWKLLSKLCFYLTVGNVVQATQSAKLINGLSAMIRDDAHEYVGGAQKTSSDRPDVMLC